MFVLNTVAVIDPDRETVVWARTGGWRHQHQPTFLDDGHLLVFDNMGAGQNRSRVQELDLRTGKVVWQYGGTPDADLFSKTLGSCQRLPNGNTLITESENGRALEVTRDHRVVWEFYNPHRAGERGELVAVLFEMLRLPADFPFRGRTRIQLMRDADRSGRRARPRPTGPTRRPGTACWRGSRAAAGTASSTR